MTTASTTPTLRALKPDDLPTARAFWETTEGLGLTPDETTSLLTAFLQRNPDISSVATDRDGRLLAAVLGGHDGRRGYLYHLAVSPEHRGQCIASALVERTLAALAAAGIRKASILVYAANTFGRAFWRQLSWRDRMDLAWMQSSTTAPARE